MKSLKLTTLIFCTILLHGCGPGLGVGSVLGGVAGAGIGSTITGGKTGTAIGAIIGTMAGGALGNLFDREDQRKYNEATQIACASGSSVQWNNPQNGHYGQIQPHPIYYDDQSYDKPWYKKPCRKYTMLAYVEGKPVTIHGLAYQEADGSWHEGHQGQEIAPKRKKKYQKRRSKTVHYYDYD